MLARAYGIGVQLDLLVLDAPPQTLDPGVIAPIAFSTRSFCHDLLFACSIMTRLRRKSTIPNCFSQAAALTYNGKLGAVLCGDLHPDPWGKQKL
jgi:hypothetical protein